MSESPGVIGLLATEVQKAKQRRKNPIRPQRKTKILKRTKKKKKGGRNRNPTKKTTTKKSSQTKLATGAFKNWIFFAVDNFPPCIPVTIFPQAGQPEAAPFGPCCSCSFYWTRDAFLKFSQSYNMVGWQQFSMLIYTEHFEVNTEMARQQ